MKKRSTWLATALAACLTLSLPSLAAAATPPDANLGLDLGSGTTAWIQQNAKQQGAKAECLAAVAKWRKDAIDTGVRWQGPHGKLITELLAQRGMTVAEYLNPKWSEDLEYIAIERAVETQSHGFLDHRRSNHQDWHSLHRNNVHGEQEVISWGPANCAGAIDSFATEKADFVNRTGREVGHYLALINPDVSHYGFGGSSGPLATPTTPAYGKNVWVGLANHMRHRPAVSEAATNLTGPHMFPVNLSDQTLAQGVQLNVKSLQVGAKATPDVTTKAFGGRFHLRGTWTTKNPQVVSVNAAGQLVGAKAGTATVVLTTKEGRQFPFTITVSGAAKPPTTPTPSPTQPPSKPQPPAKPAPTTGVVDRQGGKDRYATAAKFSAANFAAGQPVVYLASGQTFPDALAGAAVAGMQHAPILLTGATYLPPQIKAELKRLAPHRIVIIGGEGAVNHQVIHQIKQVMPKVHIDRIHGQNRFATAANVAHRVFHHNAPVVYVANGLDFPDALTAAAAAGDDAGPVLLTAREGLPGPTIGALKAMHPQRVVVVGGKGVVSDHVVAQIKQFTGNKPVVRHGGQNRFDTARIVAQKEFTPGGNRAVVANGYGFPDALVGAAVAGMNKSPVLLTQATMLNPAAKAALQSFKPRNVTVAGGQGVVSEAVRHQIASATGLKLK